VGSASADRGDPVFLGLLAVFLLLARFLLYKRWGMLGRFCRRV